MITFQQLEVNARETAAALPGATGAWGYGGGVWVHDPRDPQPGGYWRCYRLRFGVDPQAIEALAPEKVDALRLDALSLFDAFPSTLKRLKDLGCDHIDLAHRPITNITDVAAWSYSIFNAATPTRPTPEGDQYPFRVASTAFLAPDGFCVVHPDIQGHVAVLPADEGRTRVYWATPNSDYQVGHLLGPRHPVSRAAWANTASSPVTEEPA